MSERNNIIDIVDRWLRIIAALNRHPGGLPRFELARELDCHERTLRRDIERINELAARSEPSLPFHWPTIETRHVELRAHVQLDAPSPVTDGLATTDGFTAVALRVSGALAERTPSMWPGPCTVERDPDGARVAVFLAGDLEQVASWVVTLGTEATVEAPAALRSAVIGRLRVLLDRYE